MQNFNTIEAVVTEKNAFKNSDFLLFFLVFIIYMTMGHMGVLNIPSIFHCI